MADKGTILIVDDSASIRIVMKDLLTHMGFNVAEAADGGEALDLVRAAHEKGDPFRMVLTDLDMPNMNGMELILSIRREDRKVPIIMVTTHERPEELAAGRKAGANAWVVKPVGLESFTKLVERFTR